ncbi:MAG: GNAT family N-acetyltransferase [Thermodesulfobacteriota bacterium]
MEYKCEYSTLTIPNDSTYARIAAHYVRQVAQKLGFSSEEQEAVGLGVEEAIAAIIDHSFEPNEKATLDVLCERIPDGLQVTIRDRGMPVAPEDLSEELTEGRPSVARAESGHVLHPTQYWDQVSFNNLGPQGKETILIKRLAGKSITDYYEACDLGPYAPAEVKPEGPAEKSACEVRAMLPSEALEVAKVVYKTYGYTYGYQDVYYPDRLAELNKSGKIVSAVALGDDEEIVGHCALIFWHEGSRIAELGQGVVRPGYRHHGCFLHLTEYLIELARNRGLTGVYGQAVTNHTFSQRTGHKLGLRDCALIIGFVPTTVTFKGFSEQLSQRMSLLTHFLYLVKPERLIAYAPIHHEEMIEKLYDNLGVSVDVETPSIRGLKTLPARALMNIIVINHLNFAYMEVERYGQDLVSQLRSTVKQLVRDNIEVMSLHLNLSDPHTASLVHDLEEEGFFFAGILPGAFKNGDALILQYLANVEIDYDRIELDSDIAKELRDYIRARDPNLV